MRGAKGMKYTRPELEWIRFENGDILTESNELPITPAELGDEAEALEEPGSDF